jgi:hypothetical protein
MPRMAIGDDEKKKLMVLGGLLVAIIVVVMVLYNPFGGSGEEIAEAPAPPTATEPPPADPGAAAAPAAGAPAPGGITAASLVSLDGYRSDPFEPFILPSPPPPPPPPPPVEIPQPVEIMPPSSGGYDGIGIPPMGVGRSGSRPLALLPPIVPRRVATAPTAPRVAVMPGTDLGSGGVLRSSNKRLSGVVIGDSVRALLEVTVGDKVTTRVVQPGDDVDGIRILRLERVVEAGQTVTRLVVRENNQEQYVELRPAPQQQAAGGLEGLMPGAPPF